jgi:hypothetical protein
MSKNGKALTDDELTLLFTIADKDGDTSTLNLEGMLAFLLHYSGQYCN